MLGTIVNAGAILLGGFIGLLFKKGLNKRITETVMAGLALVVLYIGISGALEGQNVLIAVISLALGGAVGGALDFDGKFNAFAHRLEQTLVKDDDGTSTFGQGFVTATLLFCVGAMAIVGSLNSGLNGDHEVLFAKSLIDGISAAMFSAALGPGVLLSAAAVFAYQGAITLLATAIAPVLSDAVVAEMTCAGSLLIMGLGLNMLGAAKIKVMNYILAVFLPILLCLFIH